MKIHGDKVRLARRLAVLLLAAAGSVQAGQFILPLMAQEHIPPKYVIRDGRLDGVCVELVRAMEKAEPRLRFTWQQSGRSLLAVEAALESGQALAACALIDSPRRQQIAQIVGKPLYSARHRLAVNAADPVAVDDLDQLARLGVLVNTARGSAHIEGLKALGIAVDDSTGDNTVNLRKTVAGHGRFTYINERSLSWYMQTTEFKGKLRMLPAVLREEQLYFWISRKADPQALELVGQALAKVRAGGELARMVERWSQPAP